MVISVNEAIPNPSETEDIVKREGYKNALEKAYEIILLSDRSTDSTINIEKHFNCTIFEGSWISEGIRRNEGIKKCSHDWILEIDADERASKQLIDEAKNKIINLIDT